jgi:hypothetical protein
MAIARKSYLSLVALMYIGCGGGGGSDSSGSGGNPDPQESFKTYNIKVIDDAVVDASVEAVGCKNSKSLGSGEYTLECSSVPKYISAKGGFVDINHNGKHDEDEVGMGLPLLVNLDKKLFDVNLSAIAVTPLTTLVANIKDKKELSALAGKLGIKVDDFSKDISKSHTELFQKLNALLIIAESSGITNQLLLMKKLREKIVSSKKSGIGDILKDALEELKNDSDLKKAYGSVFISGFIDESQKIMDKSDVLKELSGEYADSDDSKVFITGFIYDAVIANADIIILDGNKKVGEVKSTKAGRWKIAILKSVLTKDKVLLFTGTATDINGDKILLKSAITTQKLREIAKKRISVADSIDLIISNVTTAQVAILEKNDKNFAKKPKELEERKNKIEVFQQEVLLKASSAIKSVIDGDSKIGADEDTYSFIFDNLVFENENKENVELNLEGKISEEELKKQGDEIKKDAILSQQLLTIESEKTLTPILEKALYSVQYSGVPLVKKYTKIVVSAKRLIEKSYTLEGKQWKSISSKEYSGKIQNNVFYFDTKNSTAPYAFTLKEQKKVHSVETNKDYLFDILGKQLYLPFGDEDTTKVGINVYSESFDVVSVFKELEHIKIVKALGADYTKGTIEEQNLALSRYMIAKISEKPKPFDRSKTELNSAIDVLDKMDVETDDVGAKLASIKSILNSADSKDKDAQVGKALFALADVTNSSTVGSLVEFNLNGSSISTSNNLATLVEGKGNLDIELLSSISDLSETSMELVHDTVLKLQDINKTLGINFADETYTFSYNDVNISSNQAKLLRTSILALASKLEYLTAFDYVTLEDAKTRTTVLNGVSAEYTNVSADPLSVFSRSDVGALNSTLGAKRLAHSKALFLEALDVLDTVVATKEDIEDQQDILDAQAETAGLKASLNGKAVYKTEDESDGVTVIKDIDLSALYSASTALDLTHTIGHDLKYEHEYFYDYSTQKEYLSGSYNQEFSRFYNEAMAKEWVAKDGSILAYVNGKMERPTLDLEAKTIVTGSNSHIPSVVKKITIKESGESDIVHTGDSVLKYLFNHLNYHLNYISSASIKYIIDDGAKIIPDSSVRYGVDILYGNVEMVNHDPIKGEVTIKVKSGFTGQQCFALDLYDTLGHYEIIHDCLYTN